MSALQVTAIDTQQYPEIGNSKQRHVSQSKHDRHGVTQPACPMLSLVLFQEHNGNYQITFSTTITVPLLQTGN